MRACISFFLMRLKSGLQYRTAAWAGIVTQFFWGFMEIRLYYAFYDASPERFPLTVAQLTRYVWLRQALLALFNAWSFEMELFDIILKGDVAYELCRPASLYGMWFARSLALRISRVVLRCVPLLVVTSLLPAPWGLGGPASLGAFAAFLVSMTLSACVCVVTLPLVELFSGALIPLPFMSAGLADIVQMSPFGAMQNAPLRIYSGNITGTELTQVLMLQLFWLMALGLIGYAMQRHGLRRLCVQGG